MGEPVQKPILYGGRFAELNREYSVGALAAGANGAVWINLEARLGAVRSAWRLGSGYDAAWLMARLSGLNGSIYGARGRHASSTSGARGCAWATVTGSSGGARGSPRAPIRLFFAPMSSS